MGHPRKQTTQVRGPAWKGIRHVCPIGDSCLSLSELHDEFKLGWLRSSNYMKHNKQKKDVQRACNKSQSKTIVQNHSASSNIFAAQPRTNFRTLGPPVSSHDVLFDPGQSTELNANNNLRKCVRIVNDLQNIVKEDVLIRAKMIIFLLSLVNAWLWMFSTFFRVWWWGIFSVFPSCLKHLKG